VNDPTSKGGKGRGRKREGRIEGKGLSSPRKKISGATTGLHKNCDATTMLCQHFELISSLS